MKEYRDIKCQDSCYGCKEDRDKCLYVKERRRAIQRQVYKARKQIKDKAGD